MKDSLAYWIWLQSALGCGAKTAGLLNFYQTPENIYNAVSLKELDSLLEPSVRRRLSSVSPSQSYPILKQCEENGWYILTPDDPLYPESFRILDSMPLALYVCGDVSLLSRKMSIAFVGTRSASVYGKRAAERLSFAVASAGAVVVSGCALGIDSYCHLGALEAGGKTVAYLGTGMGADYPKDNRSLRMAIARNGALVSEYPPGSLVRKANFPIRNRLIAASSLGTVVVEAHTRSGALITAHCAMELGKDVFAVPGEITDSAFTGGNSLIHDGAKPVFGVMDILEEYAYDYGAGLDLSRANRPLDTSGRSAIIRGESAGKSSKRAEMIAESREALTSPVAAEPKNSGSCGGEEKKTVREKPAEKELPSYIDKDGKTIYDFIVSRSSAEIDEISVFLKKDVSSVLAGLLALELAGAVRKGEGNRYYAV